MNKLLKLVAFMAVGSLSVQAQNIADISFGSAAALGGALWVGADGAAADSISIGYFVENDTSLAYQVIATDTTFENGAFNAFGFAGNQDVTAITGYTAWVQISDAAGVGYITSSQWVTYSGVAAPSPPTALNYELGATAVVGDITTLGLASVSAPGFGGSSGVTIAVPEPSTASLIAGMLALGSVMLRRRAA